MDKNDILQFEEDDTSEIGVNGKQVFVTKRINGKTTHNKSNDESRNTFSTKESENNINDNEILIDIKDIKYNEEIPNPKRPHHINKKPPVEKKKLSKKARKRRRRRRIVKTVFLLILFLVILILALFSPIFNIKRIEITGTKTLARETIESLSGLDAGQNLFKINKRKIINNIKENPYIESVSIIRKLPSVIQIDVKEREIAYQIKAINSYVYVDYQGYILEVAAVSGKVPQIVGLTTDQDTLLSGKRLSNEDITGYLNDLSKIMEVSKSLDLWKTISKITIENNEYVLTMKKENKTVYLGDGVNIRQKLSYLPEILKDTKNEKGKIFVNRDINKGLNPYFSPEK